MMGDGSFGFSCGELETIRRVGAPITYIVFSNASFGWIKASQHDDCDRRYYNVDFERTDHAMIAKGFGIRSWRVETAQELEDALNKAMLAQEPTLLDVICQPLEESAAPVRRWMG